MVLARYVGVMQKSRISREREPCQARCSSNRRRACWRRGRDAREAWHGPVWARSVPAQCRVGGCPTGVSTLKHDAYVGACPRTLGPSDFTAAQRFRSDLGLYVHLHCLVTDGTFGRPGRGLPHRPPPRPQVQPDRFFGTGRQGQPRHARRPARQPRTPAHGQQQGHQPAEPRPPASLHHPLPPRGPQLHRDPAVGRQLRLAQPQRDRTGLGGDRRRVPRVPPRGPARAATSRALSSGSRSPGFWDMSLARSRVVATRARRSNRLR